MMRQQVSKMTALRAGTSTSWRTENVKPPPAAAAPPPAGNLPLPIPFFGVVGAGVGVAGAAAAAEATPGVLVGTPPTSQTIWLPFFSQTGLDPAVVLNAFGVRLSPMSMA